MSGRKLNGRAHGENLCERGRGWADLVLIADLPLCATVGWTSNLKGGRYELRPINQRCSDL